MRHHARRAGLLTAGALAFLPATGCGGGSGHAATGAAPPRGAPSAGRADVAPPLRAAGPPAPRAATRVIRAWADTLRRGDERGAARLFALPSRVQVVPGGTTYPMRHRREAVQFQRVLPCGGRLLEATRDGRFVNALFLLTARPKARCDAPGRTARTRFVIRRGLIVEWRRAPDRPDDGRRASERGAPPQGPAL